MFEAFPKIPRLSKKAVVTEKIDGTNGQIWIGPTSDVVPENHLNIRWEDDYPEYGPTEFSIAAGSRNRFVRSGDDNFGFAAWVIANWQELKKLGPGRHFGEWWGKGIGRRYGLEEKKFSLFNCARWGGHNPNTPVCCSVVPVIGRFTLDKIDDAMMLLKEKGSFAAPGFMDPEGIIVYHERNLYKKTFEYDEGKWNDSKKLETPSSLGSLEIQTHQST